MGDLGWVVLFRGPFDGGDRVVGLATSDQDRDLEVRGCEVGPGVGQGGLYVFLGPIGRIGSCQQLGQGQVHVLGRWRAVGGSQARFQGRDGLRGLAERGQRGGVQPQGWWVLAQAGEHRPGQVERRAEEASREGFGREVGQQGQVLGLGHGHDRPHRTLGLVDLLQLVQGADPGTGQRGHATLVRVQRPRGLNHVRGASQGRFQHRADRGGHGLVAREATHDALGQVQRHVSLVAPQHQRGQGRQGEAVGPPGGVDGRTDGVRRGAAMAHGQAGPGRHLDGERAPGPGLESLHGETGRRPVLPAPKVLRGQRLAEVGGKGRRGVVGHLVASLQVVERLVIPGQRLQRDRPLPQDRRVVRQPLEEPDRQVDDLLPRPCVAEAAHQIRDPGDVLVVGRLQHPLQRKGRLFDLPGAEQRGRPRPDQGHHPIAVLPQGPSFHGTIESETCRSERGRRGEGFTPRDRSEQGVRGLEGHVVVAMGPEQARRVRQIQQVEVAGLGRERLDRGRGQRCLVQGEQRAHLDLGGVAPARGEASPAGRVRTRPRVVTDAQVQPGQGLVDLGVVDVVFPVPGGVQAGLEVDDRVIGTIQVVAGRAPQPQGQRVIRPRVEQAGRRVIRGPPVACGVQRGHQVDHVVRRPFVRSVDDLAHEGHRVLQPSQGEPGAQQDLLGVQAAGVGAHRLFCVLVGQLVLTVVQVQLGDLQPGRRAPCLASVAGQAELQVAERTSGLPQRGEGRTALPQGLGVVRQAVEDPAGQIDRRLPSTGGVRPGNQVGQGPNLLPPADPEDRGQEHVAVVPPVERVQRLQLAPHQGHHAVPGVVQRRALLARVRVDTAQGPRHGAYTPWAGRIVELTGHRLRNLQHALVTIRLREQAQQVDPFQAAPPVGSLEVTLERRHGRRLVVEAEGGRDLEGGAVGDRRHAVRVLDRAVEPLEPQRALGEGLVEGSLERGALAGRAVRGGLQVGHALFEKVEFEPRRSPEPPADPVILHPVQQQPRQPVEVGPAFVYTHLVEQVGQVVQLRSGRGAQEGVQGAISVLPGPCPVQGGHTDPCEQQPGRARSAWARRVLRGTAERRRGERRQGRIEALGCQRLERPFGSLERGCVTPRGCDPSQQVGPGGDQLWCGGREVLADQGLPLVQPSGVEQDTGLHLDAARAVRRGRQRCVGVLQRAVVVAPDPVQVRERIVYRLLDWCAGGGAGAQAGRQVLDGPVRVVELLPCRASQPQAGCVARDPRQHLAGEFLHVLPLRVAVGPGDEVGDPRGVLGGGLTQDGRQGRPGQLGAPEFVQGLDAGAGQREQGIPSRTEGPAFAGSIRRLAEDRLGHADRRRDLLAPRDPFQQDVGQLEGDVMQARHLQVDQ